jgi:eukaryotic-like serine/threonine-protein kinase
VTLSIGTRLGPYEIISPLGAGGMGEVYRARDTRLGREVAIKVLPERVAADPDALARFEREAKAVAALSHPNILALHDFGRDGAIAYAVTELLEGQTLGELLESGPLPPRRVSAIAREMAEGIAASHGKGIVHRDLKPENVFVTKTGHVKLLDFGLARETTAKREDDSNAPTERRLTEPGTVMGTVGYMSPEQVRGRALDHRTDVFSFGAILYEMLAGRRAFAKPTAAETMTAILNEDPPELPAASGIGSSLELVARRCLEKDPDSRFQDMHDVAFALEMASGGVRTSGAQTAVARPHVWPRLVAAGIVLAAVAAGAWVLARRPRPSEPPRFERVTFRRGFVRGARFGPDGRSVVYAAAWDGGPLKLYLKQPENPDSLALELPSANVLAVSPAGELAIALGCQASFAGLCRGTLARVPLTGGSPREVAVDVQQADFSPDGSLVIVRDLPGERKSRLEFPIGKLLYETQGHVSFPRVAPDGNSVAFFDNPIRGDDQGFVAIVDSSGKKKTILTKHFDSLRGLAWSESGDEIWFAGADKAERALYGVRPPGVLRTIYRAPGNLTLSDVSRDGKVLLSLEDERNGVVGLGPSDHAERDLSWLDLSSIMDMSSDGKLLLLTEQSEAVGSGNVLVLRKMDGSPPIRLGQGVGLVSPDSTRVAAIVFGSKAAVKILPVGPGEPVTLPTEGMEPGGIAWFPDNRRLLFTGNVSGKPPAFLVIDTMNGSKQLAFRSDGTWALYPLGGGSPTPVPGVGPADTSLKFVDDRTLLVEANGQMPVRVYRLDLATGKKTLFKTFEPSDKAGVSYVRNAVMSVDGSAYAYQYRRWLSSLFVGTGLR